MPRIVWPRVLNPALLVELHEVSTGPTLRFFNVALPSSIAFPCPTHNLMPSTKWLKVHSGSSSERSDEHIEQYLSLVLTLGHSGCYAVPPEHWAVDYYLWVQHFGQLLIHLFVPSPSLHFLSFQMRVLWETISEDVLETRQTISTAVPLSPEPAVPAQKASRCDMPMVKPCWLIPMATWYFMSLKMDSQGVCCAILAA